MKYHDFFYLTLRIKTMWFSWNISTPGCGGMLRELNLSMGILQNKQTKLRMSHKLAKLGMGMKVGKLSTEKEQL